MQYYLITQQKGSFSFFADKTIPPTEFQNTIHVPSCYTTKGFVFVDKTMQLTEFQNIVLYSICMFLFSGYLNDSLMFCYDKTYFRLAESAPFSGKSRCIKF